MTEHEINKAIDKTNFNTFQKTEKEIKKQFPNIDNKKLRDIIKKRLHDKRFSREYKKIYQLKIFSSFPGAWFSDIYDNLAGNNPRYWQIFINTNTRFAVALELNSKTSDDINNNLKIFIPNYKPRKITSDEEPGLITEKNLNYMKDNNCGLFIIQEQNHSALGIIDRFIRTLRDMNRPKEIGKNDSSDKEFTFISKQKMKDFINKYNNTVHSTTKHTPKEMMDNPQLEKEWIEKCLTRKEEQELIKDFKLKEGDLVRFSIPNDKMSKRRYQTTREAYKIEERNGNIYTIIAKDGTTRELPRWRLVKVDKNENYRLGKTLGTDKGIVEKINNYVGKSSANVKFKMPDGSTYNKTISRRELRFPTPQLKSKLEIDFEKSNQ